MSHPVWYTIRTIMKHKTREEKEAMSINELMAYWKEQDLKWERIQCYAMGGCVGGTICTVLMYVAHVA